MVTTQEKFITLQKELNDRHIERLDETELAITALLAQFHLVLIGPPGTGKSMLANDLVTVFEGATLFKYLMGKFTNPEEIFGPWDIPGLEEGRYERIIEGKLPTANIAFLDEYFKANSAIQNAMLTVLNERKYDNGTKRIDVPLSTLYAASNEMPEGEELWALFDRFHLRKVVDYIREPSNFVKMLKLQPDDGDLPELSLEDLETAQREVNNVAVAEHVFESLTDIRRSLADHGITVSDRRMKQGIKALQAMAFLNGRDAIGDDDYQILTHMFWTTPQEIKQVQRIILQHTNPIDLKAQELIDNAEEILGQVRHQLADARAKGLDPTEHLNKAGLEWFNKARKLGNELKRLEKQAKELNRNMNRVKQAHSRIMELVYEVGSEIIGIDPANMKMGE